MNLDLLHNNPSSNILSKEFVQGVLKAGSLFSMLENKKINTTMLFTLLLEKPDYQKFFTEITSCNSFKESLMYLLYLNPSLVKSKLTKSYLRKINGKTKPSYRSRKTSL